MGFEPTFSAGERPKTYALDRAATGTDNIKICTTIILPIGLYGCETWSLTLREERRLRVFENRVLRRVFGHKRDEVTGELRRLHNEELCDLHLTNIIWAIKITQNEMGWASDTYGKEGRYIWGFGG